MNSKATFDVAIGRADHFIALYDVLHDTRSRGVRNDWARSFQALMHWPRAEQLVRVDGKQAILVMRPGVPLQRAHFQHDYVCELLRGAIVAAVSALDRYVHDLVLEFAWKLLSQTEPPKELAKLSISLDAVKKALAQLRANPKARPGTIVKTALRIALHNEYTFQSPSSLTVASKLLGLKDFWREVGSRMPAGWQASDDIQARLSDISRRRNQIVHEADLIRKDKNRGATFRDVNRKVVIDWVAWLKDFVAAFDAFART